MPIETPVVVANAPVVPVTPVIEAPVVPVTPTDLIQKVNNFKKSQQQQAVVPTSTEGENFGFDFKQLENIKDPVAKEAATAAYKSMQGAFTRKTQELATQRKELESSAQPKGWTAERIERELLNNPEFLSAAQQVQRTQNPSTSGLTDEEFSALSEREQARVMALESKVNTLEQSNFLALVSQKDATLQAKYNSYDPLKVNSAFKELSAMSAIDIREHIYKSINYEDDVRAAYELGKSEKQQLAQEKINTISSVVNGSATMGDEAPLKEQGENDRNYIIRLGKFRLAQIKKK